MTLEHWKHFSRSYFFREFDMPLKEIKVILENPSFDRNKILKSQKKMLELKYERIRCLISGIDDILKGENKIDFKVFSKTEIESLYQTMVTHLPDSQIMQSYQNRTEAIMMKLSEKRDKAVSSFEVKSLIGEYSFIIKQLYQIEDEKPLMLEMAASYRNDSTLRTGLDDKYSAGTADFFFKAVEEFYKL